MANQLHSRAALLRWWRTEQSELSLEELARAVGVESPTTIHNWETGRTDGPRPHQLAALDTCFGVGGTLHGLYAALRTPDALDATPRWWQNFQGESRPCWAWLRVAGGQPGVARIDAGPFRLDCEVPAGEGVFVQAYAFASNPAVIVRLDRPGWVDFGYGVLPTNIGTDVIDAVRFAVVGPRGPLDHALAQASRAWLPHEFGGSDRWFDNLKQHFGHFGHRVEVARHAVLAAMKAAVSTGIDVSSVDASRDGVPQHWGSERYRRLRVARGLSLSDLAQLTSALDPDLSAVTKDHLHRLEHGSAPRIPDLVERLDMALGADGRTCTAEVTAIQEVDRGVEITFPSYWVGPVWVQFLRFGKATESRARLIWSPWHKNLKLCDGVVVTTRRSEPTNAPLRIDLAAGWHVRAGVGVHPRAIDVNEGWGLVSRDMAFATLAHYFKVLEAAFRLPPRDGTPS
ncbi:helix-turn-helix transcriptional regulator [Micromonospora sp. CPCC 205558]|uniref:helix-turn-helix transcriptional regulator n=1 Tax=Micromonospora sp. CPCC 205558 TaxID=3122403 RepID=UPI002FF188D4